MKSIPSYPASAPLSLEMAREIAPFMVKLPDGVSEFSFAGLYLFREQYKYQASIIGKFLIISGEHNGMRFFITPCCSTEISTIDTLFSSHDLWKLISPAFLARNRAVMEEAGYVIEPDRDNFDYLYLRSELATLSGKRFHKKKNHVNAFELSYPDFCLKPLDLDTRSDAMKVLAHWVSGEEHPENTDYEAAKESLELLDQFEMTGLVLYVGSVPVAWTLAETVAGGTMVAVHFEKARVDYRGAYQYINYAFARSLSESIIYINREQDLGDEGLRQAKMTYRPAGFVEKFKVIKK